MKHVQMEDDASSPGGDLARLPARSESASIASKSTLPVRGLANDFETARDTKSKQAATDGVAGSIAEVGERGGRVYPSQGESQEDPPTQDKTPPPGPVKLERGLAAEDGARTPHSSSAYSPDAVRLVIPLAHYALAMPPTLVCDGRGCLLSSGKSNACFQTYAFVRDKPCIGPVG